MGKKWDTSGAAFPTIAVNVDRDSGAVFSHGDSGMSLRDYFAGQAIAGASLSLRDTEHNDAADDEAKGIAADAYRIADAMLAERSK